MTTTVTADVDADADAATGHGRRRRDGWPLSVRSTAILAAFLVFSAASAALGVAEIYTSREVVAAAVATTAAADAQAQRETEPEGSERAADLQQTQSNGKAYSLEAANLTAAATGMVDPAILAAVDSARASLDEAVAGTDRDPIVAKMSDVWTCEVDVVTQLLAHADVTRQNSPYAAGYIVAALNGAHDALASALEQHGHLAGNDLIDAARAVIAAIDRTDFTNNDEYLASVAAADAARVNSGSSSSSDSSSSGATDDDLNGSDADGITSSSVDGTTDPSTEGPPADAPSSSSGTSTTGTGGSQSDSGTAPAPSFTTADADAAIAAIYGANAYPGDCDSINSGTFTAGSVIRATTSLIAAGGTVGWSVSVAGGTASVQYYACY